MELSLPMISYANAYEIDKKPHRSPLFLQFLMSAVCKTRTCSLDEVI